MVDEFELALKQLNTQPKDEFEIALEELSLSGLKPQARGEAEQLNRLREVPEMINRTGGLPIGGEPMVGGPDILAQEQGQTKTFMAGEPVKVESESGRGKISSFVEGKPVEVRRAQAIDIGGRTIEEPISPDGMSLDFRGNLIKEKTKELQSSSGLPYSEYIQKSNTLRSELSKLQKDQQSHEANQLGFLSKLITEKPVSVELETGLGEERVTGAEGKITSVPIQTRASAATKQIGDQREFIDNIIVNDKFLDYAKTKGIDAPGLISRMAGQYLNVGQAPDQLEELKKNPEVRKLAEEWAMTSPEFMDVTKDIFKRAWDGYAGAIGSGTVGPIGLLLKGAGLEQTGQSFIDAADYADQQRLQGQDPRKVGALAQFGRDVSSGLGFTGAAIVTGALGNTARASLGLNSERVINLFQKANTLTFGGLNSAWGGYSEAKSDGATDEQANQAALFSALTQAPLELYSPLQKWISRFDDAQQKSIYKGLNKAAVAVAEGAEEALFNEMPQEIAGNLVKKFVYDPNQEIFEGVQYAGGVGGASGILTSIFTQMIAGKRAKKQAKQGDQEGSEQTDIESKADEMAAGLDTDPAQELAQQMMSVSTDINNLKEEIANDEMGLQAIEKAAPEYQAIELALNEKKANLAALQTQFDKLSAGPAEVKTEAPAAATATPADTKETTIAKIEELNKEFDALDENDQVGIDRVNKQIFAEQNKLAGLTAIEQGIDPQGTTPTREMGLPPSGRRSEFGTFFPDRPVLQAFVKATDKALGAIQATGKRAQKLKNAIRTGITSNAGFLAGTNTEVISSEEYGKLTGGKQVAADTGTYRATFFNGKKYLVVPDVNQLAGISIEGEQRAASRDAGLDQESRATAKKLEEEVIHLSMFQGIQDEYKNIKKPKFSEQEYIVKRISDIAKEVKRTNPNALPGVSEVYLNQKNRLLDDMTFSQEFMRMVIQRVRTGQITEDLNAIRKAEQEAFSDQDKGNITAWKNSILNALEFVRNSIARYLGKGTSTKEVKRMEDAINNILDEYGIVKGEANYEFKDYSTAEPKGELKAEPTEEVAAAVTPTKEVRNIEEASQETGVPQEAILSAAQNGEIEAAKVGNDWRFGQKGIDEIKSKLSETITPTEEVAPRKPATFPTMPSIEEQTAEKVYGGETGLYDPFAGVQKKRTKAEDPAGRRGTEDQIKNADEHAAEIGGTVLYQDGDISLIRGYSLLGGTPVYIVANKGSRARTDISSYTGNLVTPEQKAQLVDIKNKIEAEDQASFNSKPFITFTDGIAFSNGVPSTIAGVLRGWKSLLNIKANLYITTYDDAVADKDNFNGPHRVIGSAGLASSKTDGSIRKMPNGDFYIMFRGIPSRTKMLETLAHELGHLHQKEAFENADLETKQMLREEHDKWVKSQTGKTAQELISSLRAVKTAKTNLGAAEGIMAEEIPAYWKSFGEWYADQVSRWAVSAEKPLTIVDKFFSRIAKALRSFYANLTNRGFLPNETFVQYLEKTLKEPARIVSETITPAIETSPNTEVESEVVDIENLADDVTYEQIEEVAPATMVNLKSSIKNVAGSFQQFSNILNDSFKSLVRFAQTIWKKIGFITVAIAGASLITSPIFVGSYINLQGPKGRADLRPTGLIKDNQNIFKPYLKKTTVEELAKSLETPAETLDLIRNAINQSQPFVGNVDIDFNSIDQFADSIKPEDFPSGNTKRSYNYNPLLEISANDVKNAAQSLKTLAKDKAKIESRIRQIMGAMEFFTKRKFKDVKIIVRQTSPSEAATFMALGRAGGFPTSEARYNPKENTIE